MLLWDHRVRVRQTTTHVVMTAVFYVYRGICFWFITLRNISRSTVAPQVEMPQDDPPVAIHEPPIDAEVVVGLHPGNDLSMAERHEFYTRTQARSYRPHPNEREENPQPCQRTLELNVKREASSKSCSWAIRSSTL